MPYDYEIDIRALLHILKAYQISADPMARRPRWEWIVYVCPIILVFLRPWIGIFFLIVFFLAFRVVLPWHERRIVKRWLDRAGRLYRQMLTSGPLDQPTYRVYQREWGDVLCGLMPYSPVEHRMYSQAFRITELDWKNRKGGKV